MDLLDFLRFNDGDFSFLNSVLVVIVDILATIGASALLPRTNRVLARLVNDRIIGFCLDLGEKLSDGKLTEEEFNDSVAILRKMLISSQRKSV